MLRVHCAVPEVRSVDPSRADETGYLHRVSAIIARGKRPVPYRTRKLSLSAPMVLRGPPRGRVGRRRTYFEWAAASGNRCSGPSVFHQYTSVASMVCCAGARSGVKWSSRATARFTRKFLAWVITNRGAPTLAATTRLPRARGGSTGTVGSRRRRARTDGPRPHNGLAVLASSRAARGNQTRRPRPSAARSLLMAEVATKGVYPIAVVVRVVGEVSMRLAGVRQAGRASRVEHLGRADQWRPCRLTLGVG